MSHYTTKELEEISIEKIRSVIRIVGERRIETLISENDKTPATDGNLVIHTKEKSLSKEDTEYLIPIQVKSKEVKELDKVFVNFPVKISDLKIYFNIGGVIYFVVEVFPTDEGEDVKIFYKTLLPIKIKNILDNVSEEQKTVTLKFNKELNKRKKKFLKVCDNFNFERGLQCRDKVEKAITIDDIKDKRICIPSFDIDEPTEIFEYEDITIYAEDEHEILIPIRSNGILNKLKENKTLSVNIDNEKIDLLVSHITKRTGERYIVVGDTIEIRGEKITIKKSSKNIIDRRNTLIFFLHNIKLGGFKVDEEKTISELKDQLDSIEKTIKVCSMFNIDTKKVYIKNLNKRDCITIEKLYNSKDDIKDVDYENIKEIKVIILPLLDEKIALYKIKYKDNEVAYINFFSENNFVVPGEENKLVYSRYIKITKEFILCCNYNNEVIINSLEIYKEQDKLINKIESDYIIMALEFIKAWDLKNNNDYLTVAEYIIDKFSMNKDDEIYIINIAQIELRRDKKLTSKRKDMLYRIKLNSKEHQYRAAVGILVDDVECVEENLKMLSDDELAQFKDYPIYSLYNKDCVNV